MDNLDKDPGGIESKGEENKDSNKDNNKDYIDESLCENTDDTKGELTSLDTNTPVSAGVNTVESSGKNTVDDRKIIASSDENCVTNTNNNEEDTASVENNDQTDGNTDGNTVGNADGDSVSETSKSETSVPEESEEKATFLSRFLEYAEIFVISVFTVLVIFTCFFRICNVQGPSMCQTLHDGETLIISNLGYKPRQGDIIVFHETDYERKSYNEPIVKRVIATGNHYVKINFIKGIVYVSDDNVFDNDDIINENEYIYLDSGFWTTYGGTMTVFVPENMLFVMGDNRNNSSDSRNPAIGLVDERRVLGRVLVRILPFSEMRFF